MGTRRISVFQTQKNPSVASECVALIEGTPANRDERCREEDEPNGTARATRALLRQRLVPTSPESICRCRPFDLDLFLHFGGSS